jgi:hypothetical protein
VTCPLMIPPGAVDSPTVLPMGGVRREGRSVAARIVVPIAVGTNEGEKT